MQATGTFVVKVTPAEPSEIAKEAGLGRMTIDKVFSGAITGTSKGEMLTGMTPETKGMAYVAIEKVTATLNGHVGTFLLSHRASMRSAAPANTALDITVVPDSGTGSLTGIAGTFLIDTSAGDHKYTFDYTLPTP